MRKYILLLLLIFPLYAQLVPFNGYIESDTPVSGSYLIEVTMTNSNNQTIWSENFYNHDIVDGYYSLVLGENGTSDLSSVDFNQILYLNVSIPSLSFSESDIPLYSTFSAIESIKKKSSIITASGSASSVFMPHNQWTTLMEIDISIPEEMMVCSFGTVSGFGWIDGGRMLQFLIYNENYSYSWAFSNPWGDITAAYHILPEGTYHIQLYGLNTSVDDTDEDAYDVAIHAFALPLDNRQETNVRVGPFNPPPNADLPDVEEILNYIK